ncbi:TPA: hypothetical protein ACX6RQ_000569 [Photobacterium damselae]|uniref:Uncharacterized protein n=2 Tax=Photobacterium damselae TaxID=38293 RepID=D0Z230_PHODD|nr:hypothetical protein [Photobacterium damselae]EEZ40847.1 hypothetical protein VDA_001879 [Photobacterium damselae subsp. damselae CIP 102761]NVH50398.1 hypothetical protein [Photobacterium damselae subsp. damselae]NVO83175.1 hypothetical protein [Photobacterium damselae subsp. damselae]PSB83746.1 hypothetical protein C5F62_07190 [Photobacterium damselae subsp. damselae]PSW86735.1 hypothetical protein CTN07_03700 [Photobacterium damselae]
MAVFFRLLLTFSSLLLSFSVYLVASDYKIKIFSYTFNFLQSISTYFFIVIVFSVITLFIARFIHDLDFPVDSFESIEIANDSFLPSYLGYFFVALSAASYDKPINLHSFLYVFFIMAIFIYCSRISFFNPIFLLFGYNFFYVTTKNGVKIILITKKTIKDPLRFTSGKVKKINEYTYLDMEK